MSQAKPADQETADKFATSWNNVYDASVYTDEQFRDWIAPWTRETIEGRSVIELGCGSGALLTHVAENAPARLVGVDLGASVNTARKLLGPRAEVVQADLTDGAALVAKLGQFDRAYSIGVLHHLKDPSRGFDSLLSVTKPGGQFHGWVYAHEGNAVVRWAVEPIRRVVHYLPWYVNKYAVALPLSVPFYLWSQSAVALSRVAGDDLPLPLHKYMLWIGKREFRFHHHVAFDQLVTPQTTYVKREQIEGWLSDPRIAPGSTYVLFRNGNGWKFGGTKRRD